MIVLGFKYKFFMTGLKIFHITMIKGAHGRLLEGDEKQTISEAPLIL